MAQYETTQEGRDMRRFQTHSSIPTSNQTSRRKHEDNRSHFSVTIGAPPAQVFAFFRDFTNLPTFMKDLKEIQILTEKKSHWITEITGGFRAEWDAEITAERAGEMIAWRSIEGSDVETSGAVFFSPASQGKGTVVSLSLDYKVPGGKLAEFLTFFTGDNPAELAFVNLRRLKARIETGEIATTLGQPSGREADSVMIVKH